MQLTYRVVAVIIAVLLFIPALISGAGFILAAVAGVTVLAVAFGAPELWDLIKKRHQGAASSKSSSDRIDVRDVVGGTKIRRGDDDE